MISIKIIWKIILVVNYFTNSVMRQSRCSANDGTGYERSILPESCASLAESVHRASVHRRGSVHHQAALILAGILLWTNPRSERRF